MDQILSETDKFDFLDQINPKTVFPREKRTTEVGDAIQLIPINLQSFSQYFETFDRSPYFRLTTSETFSHYYL